MFVYSLIALTTARLPAPVIQNTVVTPLLSKNLAKSAAPSIKVFSTRALPPLTRIDLALHLPENSKIVFL